MNTAHEPSSQNEVKPASPASSDLGMGNSKSIFPRPEDVPTQFRIERPLVQTEYLIDGEIRHWAGPREKVKSPVCLEINGRLEQQVIGEYPLLTSHESTQALESAVKAYDQGMGEWPSYSTEKRTECMEKFISGMKERRSEIVKLIMWEIGKNLPDATKEFDRTVEYVQKTIAELKKMSEESTVVTSLEGISAKTGRQPLGVVLCMGPFNYPLNETFTTLIPALLMGNTVIFKPPKAGVLLHQPLLELFRDAFPPGVVNTVYGDGKEVVSPLMSSGKIDALAFIGSSKVADLIIRQHPAHHRLTPVLGMGAKNPGIVLDSADLDATVKEVVAGALSFNGQRCTALKILFVQRTIADEFVSKLSIAVSALKAGMPWEDGVKITPLPEPNKTEYLSGLVHDAVARGARVTNERGGEVTETIFRPAVLFPVDSSMKVFHEEQFGPVVPVVVFESPDEIRDYLKSSPFSQQLSIFASLSDPRLKGLVALSAQMVSRVNINAQCQRGPDEFAFTGKRDSALGVLSISDALKVFSLPVIVAAKDTPANREFLA